MEVGSYPLVVVEEFPHIPRMKTKISTLNTKNYCVSTEIDTQLMTTVLNHINHSTCGGGGSWSRPTILVSMEGGGGGRRPSSSASSPSMAWSRSLRARS